MSGNQLKKRSVYFHLYQPVRQKIKTSIKKDKVIIISGPTATGKTEISIQIALAIGGEIISADSLQVYRGMDIGTAKASLEERALVRHHLIDICDLSDSFNVVEFYNQANAAIKDILSRDKVPIVVGGTGFYINSLIYGPPSGPPSISQVRKNLEEQMEKEGVEVLFERLQMLDPEYAKTITENDKHKIIRALEIIYLTKKKVTDFKKEVLPSDYDYRCWFLYYPREVLYPRIEKRCDEMIEMGLIDEVKSLMNKGLLSNPSASSGIGYKQCIEFLQSSQGPKEKEIFSQTFKQISRNYAKRQFTWYRKEPFFRWLNLQDRDINQTLELILQDYEQS